MDAKITKVKLPEGQTDYLFFTCVLEHAGMWYKIAVAEELYADEEGPDVTGAYTVLSQSDQGTFFFNLRKGEEGLWEADIIRVPYELLYKIGTQIDTYFN